MFSKVFKGKPFDQIGVDDFRQAMRQIHQTESPDPGRWSFGKFVSHAATSTCGSF